MAGYVGLAVLILVAVLIYQFGASQGWDGWAKLGSLAVAAVLGAIGIKLMARPER